MEAVLFYHDLFKVQQGVVIADEDRGQFGVLVGVPDQQGSGGALVKALYALVGGFGREEFLAGSMFVSHSVIRSSLSDLGEAG